MIQTKTNRLFFPAFYLAMAFTAFVGCSHNSHTENKSVIAEEQTFITNTNNEAVENGIIFQDGDGKIVALNELRGKVVFINFWATWCAPCIHEMPSIQALKDEFKGDGRIAFLMVDVDGKYKRSKAFMTKRKFDLPVYIPYSEIPTEFLGRAIPTTVILDKQGAIAVRIEGGRDYSLPGIVKGIGELMNE